MHKAAIFMFDGVEVLDFAAPFEVLSLAGVRIQPGSLAVEAVSTKPSITTRHGLEVRPASVAISPSPDVLILPGGPGVERIIAEDKEAMAWIANAAETATWVMSICSGALFLGHLGYLKGRRATTHMSDYEALRAVEPSVMIQAGRRFVRDDKFVSSAGISAGLDASLFLVSCLLGSDVAAQTASWLEYHSDGWIEP